MNSTILKAILSMDAYNRGYGADIIFGNNPGTINYSLDTPTVRLGNYSVIANSTLALEAGVDSGVGFYAIAYSLAGETIIS